MTPEVSAAACGLRCAETSKSLWTEPTPTNNIINQGQPSCPIRRTSSVTSLGGLATGISIRNSAGTLTRQVTFSDDSTGTGFNMTFGSGASYHVSKSGNMEVNITKTGIAYTAPVKVKYEPSGFAWIGGYSLNGPVTVTHVSSGVSGLNRTEAITVNTNYGTIPMGTVTGYVNKLKTVVIDYGDGQTVTQSSASNNTLTLSHVYTFTSLAQRRYATVTVTTENRYPAANQNGYYLQDPVTTTKVVSFCVTNDTLDRWTITEGANSDIVRSITKEKYATAKSLSASSGAHSFNVSYDLKETIAVKGKRDTNFDGTPDTDYITDRQTINYYLTHSYDTSLSDANVGYVRSDEKLMFTDELLDCTAGSSNAYTRYAYYTDATKLGSYLKLKGKVDPGLAWKYITYSSERASRGRVMSEVTPIEDNYIPDDSWSSMPQNLGYCIQRNYTYAQLVPEDSSMTGGVATGSFFKSEMASLTELRSYQPVSLTSITTSVEHSNVEGAGDLDLIVKTYKTKLPDGSESTVVNKTLTTVSGEGLFGKPYESITSNNVIESYNYVRARYTMPTLSSIYTASPTLPDKSLDDYVSTATEITTNGWLVTRTIGRVASTGNGHEPSPVASQSVKQVYFVGDSGLKFIEENYVCGADGSWSEPISWVMFFYNSNGRVIAKFYSDRRREVYTWTNGLCSSSISIDGITHNYVYDAFGRLCSDTKVGVTASLSEIGSSFTMGDVIKNYTWPPRTTRYADQTEPVWGVVTILAQ